MSSWTAYAVHPLFYLAHSWRVKHGGQMSRCGASELDYFDRWYPATSYEFVLVKSWSSTHSDVPNWRLRIRASYDATGHLSASGQTRKYLPVSYTSRWIWRPTLDCQYQTEQGVEYRGLVGSMYPITGPSLIATSTMQSIAMNAAKASLNSKLSGAVADAMSFLGELRETVDSIRHPYGSAVKKVQSYLKRRKKYVARRRGRGSLQATLDAASDAWLETTLGMEPLFHDIENIAQAVAETQLQRRRSVFVGYGSSSDSVGPVYWEQAYYDGVRSINSTSESCLAWAKARACVIASVSTGQDPSFVSQVARNFGISARQVLPTAWNLLPGSFIWDYFLPVGDLLQAACVASVPLAWAYTSTGTKNRRWHSLLKWYVSDWYEKQSVSGTTGNTAYYEDWTVSRVPGYTPYIEVLPSLPSLKQGANLFALDVQVNKANSEWARICRSLGR